MLRKIAALSLSTAVLAATVFAAMPAKAADPVVIRWRTRYDNQDEQKVYQTISDQVSEKLKSKGITLKYEGQPVDGYFDNLKTQLASGTAPDVFWIAGANTATYATSGALLDLKKYADADKEFKLDDYVKAPMSELARDGKLWGLPRDFGTFVVYYNADMFAEAGLKTPAELAKEGKWNWDEFLKASQKLTDKSAGTYGFGHDDWWGPWGYWVYAGGGSFFNKDKTACNFDNPGAVKGVQFLADAYKNGISPLPGSTQAGQALWLAGKEGMFFNGRWFTPAARAQAKFKWDVAEMPEGPGGKFTWGFWGPYVVNAKTAHPQEAWEVMKALTDPEIQGKVAELGSSIPSRNAKAAQDAFLKSTPPANNEAFLKGNDYAVAEFALWGGDFDDIINNVVSPDLSKVWQGKMTAADFGKGICEKVNAKMKPAMAATPAK